ncbi:tetratricopeptide repeat protein [Zoogloea sp.]|uniref:tetratricopeptide repeat protein n=1 Tax=Zoogloea sp. TaxID=49181 RepID=UPI001ACBABCB|nr:tetratricopeptide repeat protein [Zoogloea sp.]MBN8284335.1 tetratricopeptide repeat protein [Zoogloea sp.]
MHRTRFFLPLVLGVGLVSLSPLVNADLMLGTQPIPQEGGARADGSALARGRAALRARNFEQAEKAFSEAYRQNPSSVEAMLGMAAVSHVQGKEKLARDWMSSAVAMAPGQPAVLQAQARLLVEQGLPAAAEESYKAAIGARPDEVQLKLDLATLYAESLKKPGQAVSLLRDVVRQRPDMVDAQYQLGVALSMDGRVDEAGRVLDDALRREPGNARVLHARALVLLKQGQPERALELLDKALAQRKDFAPAMMARGDALQALGRSEQALEAYRRAVPMAPSSALPHALVAQTLQRLKRNGEAEKAYREALRLEPDNIRVANNLAVLLATQNSGLDEALSLARRAVDKEPGRGTYFDTLGLVLQARGDAAGARQAFERALSLEPGNAEFRQHLSQAGTATVAAMAATVAPAKALPVAAPSTAAAPVAQQAPITKPVAAGEDAVRLVSSRLEAWRLAWESKDAGRYLAFYASSFVPADKRARSAWEADRRSKLDKKGEIKVQVNAPSIKAEGEVVSVIFEQRYQSGNYSDAARKQLEWVRDGGEWKIRREQQI